MNVPLMTALHTARDQLSAVKGMVHFHMSGEYRFKTEKAVDDVGHALALMYAECLKCQHEYEDTDDTTGKTS